MVVSCEEVWREVSNYLDGEVEPGLHVAIEEHVRGCKQCAAVVEGTRNVIQLYGDERVLEIPLGFSQRLEQRLSHQRLGENIPSTRRTFVGWMAAAAAAVVVVGSLEVVRTVSKKPVTASETAKSAKGVPPELVVLVSDDGKLFHVAGCEFIRGKNNLRTTTAAVAEREGYSPCVRCLKKYLVSEVGVPHEPDSAT
jgi:Putative zinc-finger